MILDYQGFCTLGVNPQIILFDTNCFYLTVYQTLEPFSLLVSFPFISYF